MKGEYKVLSWILGIVLAFLVAFLTYTLFYVGLILMITAFIIRIGIGFLPTSFTKKFRSLKWR